ncbi:hypothetical protein BDW22DRAFT_1334446 [Trametopsis cervina]|nr:hypothetical protein BDW22DRAFT_1334446 [Trametopsis cervina]
MPATRYILSHRILDAERSRVEQDNIDRLKQRKRLTLLLDGWTDILGRELYGCVAAEINQYPIVLGLKDMTGVRTTGMNIFEAATTLLQRNDIRDGKNLLAVTTDNPSVMRNFRDRFQNEFYWVLTLPCFLHGLGNIIGAIAAFPVMKRILAKATRIVAFFEGSHYWGGQLDEEAQKLGVTRSMKQNCESRWYALALQAVSIDAYRPALQMICLRDEARRRINGLSPVAQDVINIVLYTTDFWPMLKQFHKTVAPLVDAIGNLESREATLADCMLELIRCARDFTRIPLEREENGGFWAHAKSTFNTRFHAMNTDVHQLALFLHPLCRKLAIHQAAKERSLTFMLKTALRIAHQWRWDKQKAEGLVADMKTYHTCRGHFSGGGENGLEWWESLPITSEAHPLKTLAIALFTVVPHAAEVERLFSQLGGVQTARRCNLSVQNFEALGKIRANLAYQLWEDERSKTGKIPRRRHAHMHTRAQPGIDSDLAKEIEENFTWHSPLAVQDIEQPTEVVRIEDMTEEEFEVEFERWEAQQQAEMGSDVQDLEIDGNEVLEGHVYDFEEFERVEKRTVVLSFESDAVVVAENAPQSVDWDVDTLADL